MKYLLLLLFVCGLLPVGAQFNGKLIYRVVHPNDILTMTYYQNGNNARVDAHSVSKTDTTKVINTQDTLLFDIAGLKETHLQYKTGNAYITKNPASITEQALVNSKLKMQSSITIETIGSETVNGYACTHYVIVGQTGKMVSKREVWVTTSLGTPGIQVAGGYLYFTPDFPQEQKLVAAGGSGVVVKSLVQAPGLTTEMNLTGVDTKRLPASTFQVPSWYTVVDRTNFTLPSKP